MKEQIIGILEILIVAGVCAVLSVVLKAKKESILALAQSYIVKAESAVQGSNMGSEKKRLVCAWLEAAGVKVTETLSQTIDNIVKELNTKEAWALEQKK